MITADEAYADTTKVLEDKYAQERSNIEGYIKAAVINGHFKCKINKLSDKIMHELIDAGYEVERFYVYDSNYYSLNEYFIVSWIISHEGE